MPTFTLTGDFTSADGTKPAGKVTLAWAYPLRATDTVLSTARREFQLAAGAFTTTVTIPAGLASDPLLMVDVELVDGRQDIRYYPVARSTTGTVTLSSLVPVDTPQGWMVRLDDLRARGIASAVVNGSGRLILTMSDGTTVDAGPLPNPSSPEAYDSYVGKANGAPNVSDSGHTLIRRGDYLPVIYGGKVGYGAPNTYTLPAAATYLQVELPDPVVVITGTVRFDASADIGASVCLGAFSAAYVPNTVVSPAHLSITPTYMQFSVFSSGADFTSLAPVGHPSNGLKFPEPLATDGVTTYPVRIVLDRARGRAYVTVGDFPTLQFRDWRIKQAARFPFWESYCSGAATNLGGFTEWGASTRVTAEALAAARGDSRLHGGAAALSRRPASRFRAGAQWWEPARNRMTISTGEEWVDSAGARAGNLYPAETSKATENAADFAGSGTRSRAILPQDAAPAVGASAWRCTTGYRIVATAAGAQVDYPMTLPPVTAGEAHTAVLDQAAALGGVARDAQVSIRWYDASTVQVGADAAGPIVTLPANGAPVTVPPVTATAPAGATKAMVFLVISGAVVGEAFLLTRWCLARGTHTGYVEP